MSGAAVIRDQQRPKMQEYGKVAHRPRIAGQIDAQRTLALTLNRLRQLAVIRQSNDRDGKAASRELFRNAGKRCHRPGADRKEAPAGTEEYERTIRDRWVRLTKSVAGCLAFTRPET